MSLSLQLWPQQVERPADAQRDPGGVLQEEQRPWTLLLWLHEAYIYFYSFQLHLLP